MSCQRCKMNPRDIILKKLTANNQALIQELAAFKEDLENLQLRNDTLQLEKQYYKMELAQAKNANFVSIIVGAASGIIVGLIVGWFL